MAADVIWNSISKFNLLRRAPKFVAIDKQIPARLDFQWQNKFVAHTTDILIGGLSSVWQQFQIAGEHKKDKILFHIGGGPGVGKTRFGVELLTSICESIRQGSYKVAPSLMKALDEAEQNRHYIYINLSTAQGKQAVNDSVTPTKLILSKLLKNDVADIPFEVTTETLVMAVNHVFRQATPEDPLLLQIHVDEIQFALRDEDINLLQTTSDVKKVKLRQFLTRLMDLVTELAHHNIFLFAVTSGAIQFALIRLFPATTYTIEFLKLKPIMVEDAYELLSKSLNMAITRSEFKTLINAQGGVLRLLEKLRLHLLPYTNEDEVVQNLSSIWQKQIRDISALYPPPITELLAYAFAGEPVSHRTIIAGVSLKNRELVETLFLLPKNGSYVIYYPYACLVAWNAHEGLFPTNFFPTDTLATRFTYLEFEDLVVRYLRFKMNFFVSISQGESISIKDLHRGALMNPKIEGLMVKRAYMPPVETKKKDTLVDLKKDVPFEVALGEKLIESKSTMAIWVGRSCDQCDSFVVYRSAVKPTYPCQKVENAVSYKEAKHEQEMFKSVKLPGCKVLTAFITNKKQGRREEASKLFDIYVDRENFLDYFGPSFKFFCDTEVTSPEYVESL